MGTHLRKEQCPVCADQGKDNSGDNLQVYDDGSWCAACGYVEDVRGEPPGAYKTDLIKQELPKEYLPMVRVGEYKDIVSRNISKDVCEKYHYSFSDYADEQVHVVSFYSSGAIVAQKLRLKGKQFKWLGDKSQIQNPLFGMELFEPNAKLNITICEGELDTLCLATREQGKWPIVGLLDGAGGQGIKAIAKAKDWLCKFKSVTLLFDGDKTGRQCAEECAKLLGPKAKVVNMPDSEDVCSMIATKRGEELRQLEIRATSIRPKDIVNISDYTDDDLYSVEATGITIPYPKLNKMIHGLKAGRLYLFCAGSGMGKSTLAKELALHLMEVHNINVGSIFLEQSDKEAMKNYIAMLNNVESERFNDDKTLITSENRQEARELLSKHAYFYKHFGSLDSNKLLQKIEYMMLANDCDYVILDHISMVVSGGETEHGERKDIDMLMTNLRTLIQTHNKSVIAITHLKRPHSGRESFNNGGTINLDDLRGSATLEQVPDFVVAIEGNQFDEAQKDMRKLKVLKCRLGGKIGYADLCKYSDVTGRLTAIDDNFEV